MDIKIYLPIFIALIFILLFIGLTGRLWGDTANRVMSGTGNVIIGWSNLSFVIGIVMVIIFVIGLVGYRIWG